MAFAFYQTQLLGCEFFPLPIITIPPQWCFMCTRHNAQCVKQQNNHLQHSQTYLYGIIYFTCAVRTMYIYIHRLNPPARRPVSCLATRKPTHNKQMDRWIYINIYIFSIPQTDIWALFPSRCTICAYEWYSLQLNSMAKSKQYKYMDTFSVKRTLTQATVLQASCHMV